jgi:hypothetical protein
VAIQQQQLVRVDARVPWTIQQTRNGHYVAKCDPLRLTLQAESWADLMEDIAITLDALLKDLLETNELSQFLSDQGWKLSGAMPSHPEGIRFDVPFFPAMISHGSATELHQ